MNQMILYPFHGDTLIAVEREDGVFIAVKPICDRLGIGWNKQLERMKRDPVLAEGMTMMGIPSAGGPQETTLLRLDLVNGWLFGIDANRVRPEAREAVLRYKRECYRALFEYFYRRTSGREEEDAVVRTLLSMRGPGRRWYVTRDELTLVNRYAHTLAMAEEARIRTRLFSVLLDR